MQCKKCGYENMDGAQRCQKCGAPMGQLEQRSGDVPAWFGSRIIGLLAVIAGAVAIAGVFLPWVQSTPHSYAPAEAVSASASGWDLITGSGDVQEGAEPYAILVFAGGIVLALGAMWALLGPESKTAWATATLGGLMALAGSIWAWMAVSDYAFPGVDAANSVITHQTGLYLIIAGGIAGVIASVVGRLGTTPERIRL